MLRSIRGSLTTALGIAVALSLVGGVAWAAPIVLPGGVTSTSNGTSWQWGWGNDLSPDYSVSMTGNGVYYIVDRSPSTVMSSATLALYQHSIVSGGTMFSNIVDIVGTYNYPPVGGWVYSIPGMANPMEGVWYLHMLPYETGPGGTTYKPQIDVPIGIDVTAPGKVTGVLVTPNPSVPYSAAIVTAGTRATVKWDGLDYDALSGTAFYTIYVDDVAKVSGGPAAMSVAESLPPVWYQPAWTDPYSFTIEDLPAGRHEIKVSATDRATNEGPKSAAAVVYADPDFPTIKLTFPVTRDGVITEERLIPESVGRYPLFQALVSDGGGVQYVDWYVDYSHVGRSGAGAGALVPDLARFGLGWHTVTGVVTDLAGRTAAASTSIRIGDLSVPFVTRMKDTPDPFFPIRRDGYRDDMILTFRLSERAAVWLEVYDANNNLIRNMFCGWRRAGSNRLKWGGQGDNGAITEGVYHYRLVSDDGQGNRSYTGWGWTRIRSTILKRLSGNRVRVLYR